MYPAYLENEKLIRSRWHEQFGDRINELVIIGQDLAEASIRRELSDCLCTPAELRQMEAGARFRDPFPKWE